MTTLEDHQGGVRSLSITNDGRLISGSEDKSIKIWDTRSWTCVQTIDGHDDFVRIVLGLNGNRIASGSRDNTLKIWNYTSGK